MQKVYNEKYIKIKNIGQGAYGKIVLCKNIESEELVAVKKLFSYPMSSSEEADENIPSPLDVSCNREANALKNLLHPNIVSLETSFVRKERLYLVMPFAGVDLGVLVDDESYTFSMPDVQWIFSKIVAGLCYIHCMNYMHRVSILLTTIFFERFLY